ncbi:uncharacterized protein LOC110467390 isoform X1 [Mizuhopecten yessoensis]|uniref:Ectoine hydroxylase n=2 Tax=Mizuhopecten yessoensis TaxID=6573 RepID=A0A210PLN2_MIZYE|nr:uncharacterized protein LOC110467390 isoform X1 [Mizuhopecten yessoensis]OWF37395.1 Ectoine hydroxylase [Mizuhopecten yessoensis]
MSSVAEYKFDENFEVTAEVKRDFDEYGYILLRGVLDKEELSMVEGTIKGSDAITKYLYYDKEYEGKKTDKVMWSHPGSDVTGMVARSEKLAGIMEKLLGGEVYHYHTKLMMKEAGTGARHVWHQDYGYWYHNGCLFPDMGTVFLALDPCRRENSCLQVLRGSHKCGRIEHKPVREQYAVDEERRVEIAQHYPHQYIEMEAGDALYFHCNLIHSSSDNTSSRRRWAFLTAYNRASNNPVIEHHHPQYTPLDKVPNSAIKECANYTDMEGKIFLDPKRDASIKTNFRTISQA